MLLLTELCDDILLEILSYFRGDRSNLRSLASTNRRLNPLATTILYRQVYLEFHWHQTSAELTDSPEFELLQRTVTERTSLGRLILNLKIRWDKGGLNSPPPPSLYECINSLLKKLPSVRSFHFSFSGSVSVISSFRFDLLDAAFMSRLHEFSNSYDSSSLSNIAKLIQLKSIESISLSGSDEDIIIDTLPTAVQAGPKSSLLRLELESGIYIPAEVLHCLLSLTPGLKELSCDIPGSKLQPKRPQPPTVLSPGNLCQIFEPIERTLTTLRLREGFNTNWSAHDGSRLDLSQFRALKHLTVIGKCFFAARGPSPSRSGLFQLLPLHLETLRIEFEHGWDFLVEYRQLWPDFEDFDGQGGELWPDFEDFDGQGGDQNVKRRRKQIWDRFEADGFQVSADKFFWLEEIALHKDRYPNLASVTIKESESLWHGFGKHQWDLPPRLREVFEGAGVELKVTLRVPGKKENYPWMHI